MKSAPSFRVIHRHSSSFRAFGLLFLERVGALLGSDGPRGPPPSPLWRPPRFSMLTWLACGSQGAVPPPWEVPPASLAAPLPSASLTSPETPSGGNPASCPKYAAWAQHEIEQLHAQLQAQRKEYAQLLNETARLQSDASEYYRTGATKQMLTCDCAQCQSGPPSKPNPNQGLEPALEGLDAPPWSAPEQKMGAPAHPKSAPEKMATNPNKAPEKPASAPEPPKSAPGKAGTSTSPVHATPTSSTPTPADCPPAPRLPSGSHCILVVAEAPEDGNPEMGMANRMHRMADALVSIGVVVHVILHADTKHPATTLPGMRVYSGAMREQYTKALAAAGDELRLGVVFANMVTVRLRKRLGVLQKGLVQRAARNDRRGDASQAEELRVQARLADTSLAPFTDEWPEEQCMHWLV